MAPFVVSARSCLVCAGVLGSLCGCGRSRLWFYRLRFRSRPRRLRIRGSLQLTALLSLRRAVLPACPQWRAAQSGCPRIGRVPPTEWHRFQTIGRQHRRKHPDRAAPTGWPPDPGVGRPATRVVGPYRLRVEIIDPPPHIDGGTIAVGETVVGFMYGYDEVDTLEFMADCAFAMLHERRALMLLRGGAGVRALP